MGGRVPDDRNCVTLIAPITGTVRTRPNSRRVNLRLGGVNAPNRHGHTKGQEKAPALARALGEGLERTQRTLRTAERVQLPRSVPVPH